MGGNHDGSVVVGEGDLKVLDQREREMIRRLVEEQNRGRIRNENRERKPAALADAQGTDWPIEIPGGDQPGGGKWSGLCS